MVFKIEINSFNTLNWQMIFYLRIQYFHVVLASIYFLLPVIDLFIQEFRLFDDILLIFGNDILLSLFDSLN